MDEKGTDLGNARRLVRLHGEDLRYVRAFKKWFWWDEQVWRIDETGEVDRRARKVAPDLYQAAALLPDGDARKSLAKAAIAAESRKSLEAIIALAQAEFPIPATPEDLDQNGWLLNTTKGLVDLQSGDLLPHDRAALCTRIAGTGYVPDARSDLWDKCLETWLPDPEVRNFVQRAVGYSLIGQVLEHVLLILWGSGANGKSVFTETVRKALGGYADQTPADSLTSNRSHAIPHDIARLRGSRLVFAAESEEGHRLSEAKIKSMTGGDRQVARFLFGSLFEFDPTFTIWLSTNHRPEVRGTDEGIWRRIKLVPFNVRIPEDQRDPDLGSKLAAELEAVLAWAIEGALEYQRIGLAPPAAVEAATREYRHGQDIIAAFLEEVCIAEPGATIKKSDLFDNYEAWCRRNNEGACSSRVFLQNLKERGIQEGRNKDERFWKGIRLSGETYAQMVG